MRRRAGESSMGAAATMSTEYGRIVVLCLPAIARRVSYARSRKSYNAFGVSPIEHLRVAWEALGIHVSKGRLDEHAKDHACALHRDCSRDECGARVGRRLRPGRSARATLRGRARVAAGLGLGAGLLELERPPLRLGARPPRAREPRPSLGAASLGGARGPLADGPRPLGSRLTRRPG